ncbi:Sensor histidine kinase RcsC [Paraburkholderia aspalathi]|uniref:response regulator n=1 Tax=Paraburkholderia aspalathi TaxID=1324617 RepID=UPI00190B9D04|nr:response regulator [Paraburkholderia aspalathi]MBK3843965.1 response regulator [Paraburkholderia aspalathi]CAE6864503.1 Sensor histidine kinase RcsC [Paraburkholderia aspalathi]
MGPIRIDQQFRFVAAIVLVVTISGVGVLLAQDWKSYQSTRHAATLLQVLRTTLNASEYLSAERGPMNALLGAEQSDQSGLRAALDVARARSDSALDAAVRGLQETSCDDCKRGVATMQSARENLSLARQDIDRLAALPREERPAHAVEQAIEKMFQLIEDMNPVNHGIIFQLIRDEPSMAEHVVSARLAAELREEAGRAGSLFTPALMSRRAMNSDELERLWLVVGRVHALGDLIMSSSPADTAEVKQLRRIYFGAGIAYLRQTARAEDGDASLPTAASFAQHYVPLMRPITALRDAELDVAIRDEQERETHTRNALVLLTGVLATIVLSVMFILVTFSRRIIGPISSATESILSFASGNYSTPAHSIEQRDQIGALLASLQALRAALVRNEQLEAERLRLVEQLQEAVIDGQVQSGLLKEARDIAVASAEAKGRFLAMMSHEIRTPMHGLLGLLEALQRTLLNTQQRHYLDVANSSAKALMQILNDILEFTLADTGVLALASVPTDIREVIDEAMAALAGSGESKGLQMEVYVHPYVAAMYLVDGYRLRQVLLNLLSSAIKFTSQGRVGIWAGLGKVDDSRQELILKVYDTGVCIPETARTGLFLPFEQPGDVLTRHVGGVGIGLAISKRIVEMMGGTLEVASADDLGTSVTLRIDLTVEREQYDFPQLKGGSILISTETIHVARALKAFAFAAGLEPFEGQLWSRDIGAPALHARDAQDVIPGRPGHSVLIGRRYDAAGANGVVELANYWANPPSWHIFVACCLEAIAPHASHHGAVGGPEELLPDWCTTGTILIADDSPVNCLVLTNQLKQLGCELVLTCGDGEQAWRVLSSRKVSLLITDVYMPKLNGIELISRLRAAEQTSSHRTQIVAITASVLKETNERCRDAGADVFLTKPVSGKQLRNVLTRMQGQRGG